MEEDFNFRNESKNDLEKEFEKRLRPIEFGEFNGQVKIVENLKVFVEAAKLRDESLDHVLLAGPPGLGKNIHPPSPCAGGGKKPKRPKRSQKNKPTAQASVHSAHKIKNNSQKVRSASAGCNPVQQIKNVTFSNNQFSHIYWNKTLCYTI